MGQQIAAITDNNNNIYGENLNRILIKTVVTHKWLTV